jgi:ubiquinone/menaquinone biosynthesis C-methylase UbiE
MIHDIETSVIKRYEAGAKEHQPNLCCPTDYEPQFLTVIPPEIIAKDYGCGDPTRYVNQGEIVLDLGSGAGKNCYIIAQKVGQNGQVIGVDFNEEMLNLARKYQAEIAEKLGYHNTKFIKGKIQDLKLPLELVELWLKKNPIGNLDQVRTFEAECDRLREEATLIKDNSVNVVVSNCVLNLVKPRDKQQLFAEIYRVLKTGGRAIISDIVCEQDLSPELINDTELWSGCIAGAFREDLLLAMFKEAGFVGIEILARQAEPWQVIKGIEFRSLTVRAYKLKPSSCCASPEEVIIYRGPWQQVEDEQGNIFKRGEKIKVTWQTYQNLTQQNSPYSPSIISASGKQQEPYLTNINQQNTCC